MYRFQNFSEICNEPETLLLNQTHKDLIVFYHNFVRAIIASGDFLDFPGASRMGQMVWNDELANIATLNTKQCKLKHDICRNTGMKYFENLNLISHYIKMIWKFKIPIQTESFHHSGQNIAKVMTTGNFSSPIEDTIVLSISHWVGEYERINSSYIAALPRVSNGSE